MFSIVAPIISAKRQRWGPAPNSRQRTHVAPSRRRSLPDRLEGGEGLVVDVGQGVQVLLGGHDLGVAHAFHDGLEVRSAYTGTDLAAGKKNAETILASFPACPIGEIARLGRTLRQWKATYLGYFTTDRSNNGGTQAINGIIELHRRIARGYRNRDNHRLRMLLVAGGLDPRPLPEVR